MTIPRSAITPAEAIERALAAVGTGVYYLGTGTWPRVGEQMDCVGFAWSWCYQMPRHIPGLNAKGGGLGDVEDDANTNSLIGDALTDSAYVQIATDPLPGDLVMYPTIHDPRVSSPFIGHVGIITDVSRWQPGNLSTLGTVQCCGPNGRTPGVLALSGAAFQHHDELWPLPQHRSRIVRVLQAPSVRWGG